MNEKFSKSANPNLNPSQSNKELYFFLDWIPQGIANPDANNIRSMSVVITKPDNSRAKDTPFADLLKELYVNDIDAIEEHLEFIIKKAIYTKYKGLENIEDAYRETCSKIIIGLREDGFIVLCLKKSEQKDSQADGDSEDEIQQMSNLAARLLDVIKDITGHTHLFHEPLVPRINPLRNGSAKSIIDAQAFTTLQPHDLEPVHIDNESIHLPSKEAGATSIEDIVKRILDAKTTPQSQRVPNLENLKTATRTDELAVSAIAKRYSEVRERALRLAQLQEFWKLPKAVTDIKNAITTWAAITILMFLLVYFSSVKVDSFEENVIFIIFGLAGPIYMFIAWIIKNQLEKPPADSYDKPRSPSLILSTCYFFVVIPSVLMFLLFLCFPEMVPKLDFDNARLLQIPNYEIKKDYVLKFVNNLPYISFILLVFSVLYLKSIAVVYLIEKNYISILQRAKGFLAYGNIYIKTLTNALARTSSYTTEVPQAASWGNFDAAIDTLNTSIETKELSIKEALFRYRVVALFFGIFTSLFAILAQLDSDEGKILTNGNGSSKVIAQIRESTKEIKDDTKQLAEIMTRIDGLPDQLTQLEQTTGTIKDSTDNLGAIRDFTNKLPAQFDKIDEISKEIKKVAGKLVIQEVGFPGTIVPGIEDSCSQSAPLAVLFFKFGSSDIVEKYWIAEKNDGLNNIDKPFDYKHIFEDKAKNIIGKDNQRLHKENKAEWITDLVDVYQNKCENEGYFAFIGYADMSGNSQTNLTISQNRAQKVEGLIKKCVSDDNEENIQHISTSWIGEEYMTAEGDKIKEPAADYSRRVSLHWCKAPTNGNSLNN